MLVLTRHVGEKIVARTKSGEVITLYVLHAQRGKSRVGIDAPDSVKIHREEIARQIPEWADVFAATSPATLPA